MPREFNELRLFPNEIIITMLSLADTYQQMRYWANKQDVPWTPDARKDKREMMEAALSVMKKINRVTGMPIPDFDEEITQDDIDRFTTKPS